MKAYLSTPNYWADDVEVFGARRGERFTITFSELGTVVGIAPELDVFSNNDAVLQVDRLPSTEEDQTITVEFEALSDGQSFIQVQNETGAIVKRLGITVFSDQAARFVVTTDEPILK